MHGRIGHIDRNRVPVLEAAGVGGRCNEIYFFGGGIVDGEELRPGVVVFEDPALFIIIDQRLLVAALPADPPGDGPMPRRVEVLEVLVCEVRVRTVGPVRPAPIVG